MSITKVVKRDMQGEYGTRFYILDGKIPVEVDEATYSKNSDKHSLNAEDLGAARGGDWPITDAQPLRDRA
jgi:hypothetical protein